MISAAVLAFAMQADASTAKVVIELPPGPCRILVDGTPKSFDQYRALLRKWKATQPEVGFQPDPAAEFKCVDRVLRPLVEAKLTKFGFVGNEPEAQ